MPSDVRHIRTVVESGPLTVDYILNSKGRRVYRFEARTVKHADQAELRRIMKALYKELERCGVYKPSTFDKKKWRQERLEEVRARDRAYWQANREAINAKRRARYAEKKQLSVAMEKALYS